MELIRSYVIPSPLDKNRIRLCGEVRYDFDPGVTEIFWFEVSEEYQDFFSDSGNPWLVCLLPLAAVLGENLHLSLPVDPLLLENAPGLMRIWKSWFPKLKTIDVHAEALQDGVQDSAPKKTVALFSGGVDSYFTLLHHQHSSPPSSKGAIDDLIFVWGFDIPLAKHAEFQRAWSTLSKTAAYYGKTLINVVTNLRETLLRKANWATHWHGCALASVSLALEKRFQEILIPSTHSYGELQPWGSHPLTDPLLSTTRTRITHDGAAYRRTQKTEVVAGSEIAMQSLRVCWKLHSDQNCSACSKCFRTMATLEILDALKGCSTFRRENFSIANLAKVYCSDENDISFFQEVRDLAASKGRLDIAAAIDQCFRRSKKLRSVVHLADWMAHKPFLWRYESKISRWLESVAIV